MKDPTTDLWTLPIVGSAGKTTPMNTHDEQDAFVNLREEIMEGASAACSFTTSSLAIPIFASIQAYKTEETLTNPPPNEFGLFSHTIQTKANSINLAPFVLRTLFHISFDVVRSAVCVVSSLG